METKDLFDMYRIPEQCSQEVWDLIDQCLKPNPDDRPNAQDIVDLLRELDAKGEATFCKIECCRLNAGSALNFCLRSGSCLASMISKLSAIQDRVAIVTESRFCPFKYWLSLLHRWHVSRLSPNQLSLLLKREPLTLQLGLDT